MQTSTALGALVALSLLAACGDREVILPGKREGVREVLGQEGDLAPVSDAANRSVAAAMPAVSRNAAWTQAHGTPSSRTDHPALNANLTQVWSANIGQADKRRARITAQPVAEAGRIFTLDSAMTVTATSASGATLWTADLTPLSDRPDQASGGSLALGGGRLYVTSAFGVVAALDPATGQTLWTQKLGNTGTGNPSFYEGVVYLVAGDTTAWALEADNGRVRWQIDGLSDINNVAGGPAPVVTPQQVIFGFGNAELQAAFRQGGLRLWNAGLPNLRRGLAIATVDDITGDPVAYGDTVYVGNQSGAFVALNIANGERRWSAPIGATGPAWVTSDSVYLVSDVNNLVRLDAETGETVWSVDLPGYVERRKPQKRRDSSYVNYGPVLAGGHLVVPGSDGTIRLFNPADGALTGSVAVPGGATAAPIVVDGTLYVVTGKGQLIAFR